ncbi:hypothetical protein AWN76_010715 [Rhodothermaceae bacterium RA]|nr:hypothetical protein AWN76_010715 [Rhodothermaceae bacterium RA]
MWFVLAALAALALPAGPAEVPAARAQGFNAVSGRNHPELDWQVAETAHFRIMYPAHLAGIEREAAPIAEAGYAALTANLGVSFDEKIRIYLSDEDDIVNGFAVPVGTGHTNIWVHQSGLATVWTGREKWLRKVIAHELAHLVHYRAVQSPLGPFAVLFGNPLPRFWTEGLAQYQTEAWDAQRGDRWLRTAVLDDRLSYTDGRSTWNGRLLYAVGHSQVRYFARQYGDSTLARLLAHRKPVLLGLSRVHDFEAALEAVAGRSYRAFYDDWRRDVNVYYNTLAGQMEPFDSLGVAPMALPGQYVYDVRFSPDTARVALLIQPSLEQPVRRLVVLEQATGAARVVAEGSLRAPVAWSPDGRHLAFARLTRGAHGSLLYDLYLAEAAGGRLRRLTHSRRAAAPAFSPDGQRLAFVGSAGGTDQVVLLDLDTGTETPVTHFAGDVQLGALAWQPGAQRLALARFLPDGTRDLALLDLATGRLTPLTDGTHDDRDPVWSPDGRALAYTSFRDDVPNVFVYDLDARTHRRVTYLALGAAVRDWLPPDSLHAGGSLVLLSQTSKSRDRVFRVDAGRGPTVWGPATVPPAYATWTTHAPPVRVPGRIAPADSVIRARYRYRAWRNLTHVASLVLPYYGGSGGWGLAGFTTWIEPLAKHGVAMVAGMPVRRPLDDGFLYATYLNNRWRPSLLFNVYRGPASGRLYGNGVLVDRLTGGDVTVRWPVDGRDRPYHSETVGVRLRYAVVDPVEPAAIASVDGLPPPASGTLATVQVSYTRRFRRPYRYELVHPLDGRGVRLRATGAARVLGADRAYLRGDLAAYVVLPAVGRTRLFLYGRAQAQHGTSLPQDYLGLSRYDDVRIVLPGLPPVELGDAERVRGTRRYAVGDRVLFGSAEYRLPLLPDLRTRLLGVVSLGATALAAFVDGGVVWRAGGRVERLGTGLEVKNALRLGSMLEVGHALGIARRVRDLGAGGQPEVYYRIRAAVPF